MGYGTDKSGYGSDSNDGYGSSDPSNNGSNNNSSAPGPTTAFRPTPTRAKIISDEANEPYFYMGFFPTQAIRTLEPTSVNESAKDAADAIYYTVTITGIVHGINLEEDSIYVQYLENGDTKKIPVALGEIKTAPFEMSNTEDIKNYGRYTGEGENFSFTLPIVFTYEMLVTITLTIQNSGLGLDKKAKKVAENDGAVLTANNGIETYKIIVYRNSVGSFA